MKKLSFFLIILSLIFFGCGGNKYAEVKKVMEKITIAYDSYFTGLENAKDSQAVISAINGFKDTMAPLVSRSKELQNKYPEIQGKNTMPKELQETYEKMRETSKKAFDLYETEKMKKMLKSPDVQAANESLVKVLFSR